jgi:hypothetical protein
MLKRFLSYRSLAAVLPGDVSDHDSTSEEKLQQLIKQICRADTEIYENMFVTRHRGDGRASRTVLPLRLLC